MKGKTALIIAAAAVIIGVLLWLLVIERAINESKHPSKAAAEPLSQSFFPSSAHAMPNEDITVYVHAKGNQTLVIRGYNVELSFDPSIIRFKNITYYIAARSAGLGQTTDDMATINQTGKIRIAGESNTNAGFALQSGYSINIAAITFTIVNTTPTYVRYVKSSSSPKYYAMNADYYIQEISSDIGNDFPINQVNSSSSYALSSCPSSSSSSSSRSTASSSVSSSSSSAASSSAGSSSISSSSSQSSAGSSSSQNSSASSSSSRTQSSSSVSSANTSSSSSSITTIGPSVTPPVGGGEEQPYEAVVSMKIRLQGVVTQPPVKNPVPVKVRLVSKTKTGYDSGYATLSFLSQADGTWTASVRFTGIYSSVGYALLVKGPRHLQRKVCDSAPADSSIYGTNNTFYHCGTGSLSLKEGDNTVDMSKILLLAGDLPEKGDQNGLIDAYDTSYIRQHIQSLAPSELNIGDLNYDGVIDSQDFSLVLTSILTKYDEE